MGQKNLDWNMALIGKEDWKSAMSSEVFRNYLGIVLANEQAEKMEQESKQPAQNTVPEQKQTVQQPIRQNEDYKGVAANQKPVVKKEEENEVVESIDDHVSKILDDLYETGAGESKYLDVGVTPETEKELNNGIDYHLSDPYMKGSTPKKTVKKDIYKAKEEPKEPKEDNESEEKELDNAEKDLGLDKDANYILSKMLKVGE